MKKSSSFLDRLTRVRVPLYIFAGLIFVAVITTFIVLEVNRNNAEESVRRVEDIEEQFATWLEDGHDDTLAREDMEMRATELITSYPRQYGAARAYFILASIGWELEDYEQASEYFQKLATQFPSSYLASIALYNAAVSEEELGNAEAANSLYQNIVDAHADSFEAPRALFSLGRLKETEESYEDAATLYRQLEKDYEDSVWTNLGKSRTLYLEIQGLASVTEEETAEAE